MLVWDDIGVTSMRVLLRLRHGRSRMEDKQDS